MKMDNKWTLPLVYGAMYPIGWGFILAISWSSWFLWMFCLSNALLAGACAFFLIIQKIKDQPPNEVLSAMKVICGFVIPIIFVLGGMAYTAIENLPPPKPKEKQEKQQKEKVLAWRKGYSAYIYKKFSENNKGLLFSDIDRSVTVVFNPSKTRKMVVPFFLGEMEGGRMTTYFDEYPRGNIYSHTGSGRLFLEYSSASCNISAGNTWNIKKNATLPTLRWEGRERNEDYRITFSYREGYDVPYAVRGVVKNCPAKKALVFMVPTKIAEKHINTCILVVICARDGSVLSSSDGRMSIAVNTQEPEIVKSNKWSTTIRGHDRPIPLVIAHNCKKPVDIFIAFRPL